MLSFGDEAEEMEPESARENKKMKSSYDFLPDAPAPEKYTAPPVPVQQPPKSESPKQEVSKRVAMEERLLPVREETPEKQVIKEPVTRLIDTSRLAIDFIADWFWTTFREQSEIDRLKSDIRKMEQERRDEKEGKVPEKKQKKKSLVELEREKFTRRGAATTGGAKSRKKMQDDVSLGIQQ